MGGAQERRARPQETDLPQRDSWQNLDGIAWGKYWLGEQGPRHVMKKHVGIPEGAMSIHLNWLHFARSLLESAFWGQLKDSVLPWNHEYLAV